jgi:hypothetical protein
MYDFVEAVKVLNAPAGLLGRKGRKDDKKVFCLPRELHVFPKSTLVHRMQASSGSSRKNGNRRGVSVRIEEGITDMNLE